MEKDKEIINYLISKIRDIEAHISKSRKKEFPRMCRKETRT